MHILTIFELTLSGRVTIIPQECGITIIHLECGITIIHLECSITIIHLECSITIIHLECSITLRDPIFGRQEFLERFEPEGAPTGDSFLISRIVVGEHGEGRSRIKSNGRVLADVQVLPENVENVVPPVGADLRQYLAVPLNA